MLEELILKEKLIRSEDLKEISMEIQKSGLSLQDALINKALIDEKEILNLFTKYLNIDYYEFSSGYIDEEALKIIPKEIALKYCLIPICFKGNKICIVINDPMNISAINDVRFKSNREAALLIAQKRDILSAIYIHYNDGAGSKVLEELKKKYESSGQESITANKENEEVNNAPMVKLVNSILTKAITCRASDIHIEPFKDTVIVRFRIDGVLQEVMKLPVNLYSALTARIKIMANLNITERRLPQDGKIQYDFNGLPYDFRISTLPAVFGEKIVVRILGKGENLISLDLFNSNEKRSFNIHNVLNSSNGMILVTGPTGSGKSTTLFSMLNSINKKDKNITTIEDPVEYTINGVTQINVNNKAGLTFASGLRSILRQDPDVIMLGEIRDEETAEIAVRASITGHLVLSTLHTRDSFGCISRLKDMGVPYYLLADAFDVVIAQRLVRKICNNCKVKYAADEKDINFIRNSNIKYLYKGKGCSICNNSGYNGRTIVHELIYFDTKLRKIIGSNGNTEEVRDYCIGQGMRTLNQNCTLLVRDGITTLDEYVKNAYEDS
jgi:type IV pilus assembly protein PilB